MNPAFWAGKTVLVTGHTGFKGSWLSLWLQSLGAHTIGLSLPPPTEPSLFKLAQVGKRMTSIIGDIRDYEHLANIVEKHQPDLVFHLAAQSLVRSSYTHPIDTFSTNIMGAVHLLEVARNSHSIKSIVVVTSDKCYANPTSTKGLAENDALGGHDPYSSSKACAEIVTAAYQKSFFIKPDGAINPAVATARGGNVIGGGDRAQDRLLPDVFKALSQKSSLKIRQPDSIRPWQHVLDCLHGYLTLAEHLWENGSRFSEAWNIGPMEQGEKPVSWILQRVSELWGAKLYWEPETSSQPHEAKTLTLDCTKAFERLGWKPKLSLDSALEWSVEWETNLIKKHNPQDTTLTQITRFQSM